MSETIWQRTHACHIHQLFTIISSNQHTSVFDIYVRKLWYWTAMCNNVLNRTLLWTKQIVLTTLNIGCMLVGLSDIFAMTTSSNWNILRVTGRLWGESSDDRWSSVTEASDTELWYFFYLRPNRRLSKQFRRGWFETLSRSLWRHCNALPFAILCAMPKIT